MSMPPPPPPMPPISFIPPPLRFRCTFSGTICDAMRRRGWQQSPEPSILSREVNSDWSLFFCDMTQFRDAMINVTNYRPLLDYQRLGHFRNCQEISRKNNLVKNLKRFRGRLERAFGKATGDKCLFMPETFILPSEHSKFLAEFRTNSDTLWIIKPAAGAQGRGIFIFKSPTDYLTWRTTFDYDNASNDDPLTDNNNAPITCVTTNDQPQQQSQNLSPRIDTRADTYVVQKYITDPYLIGGRKFDIRFYVLVTSFTPLRCYIYREGFARFSAGQFSLDALQDVYIHLTNVAIQKTSEDYNPEKGSKWSLQSLREYLSARHGREKVQGLFNTIDMIVIRTLQSAVGLVSGDPHCFEVYGFDVLIDRMLKPWLLEVNASPAFTPSNEEDYVLKLGLIDDTATVLDLEGRLTTLEIRIGGYDLLYDDGPVYANPNDSGHAIGWDNGRKLNSFLGCKNDRVPQLRDLHRSASILKSLIPSEPQEILKLRNRKSNNKDDRFLMPPALP
ncbi:probable tubulin polyglutamylase TTLL9 [Folsomia candida]|uniref:Tubulin--tyrosine ligase-like protein 9 n=1 Tax=Folsomia candida TaxID=158441 RepID=A0A226EQL1_FOLCA|nr:probable tubulin polyglutamylase TTLL9 [Folsomia candida]OXA59478.1 putative tubulin polyglutamylase TTLL9 [Folsomia candida]